MVFIYHILRYIYIYEQRRPPALQAVRRATFVKAEKRKEKYCDVMGHLSKMLRMCMLIIIDYICGSDEEPHFVQKRGSLQSAFTAGHFIIFQCFNTRSAVFSECSRLPLVFTKKLAYQ
jgi:hypothetical protein